MSNQTSAISARVANSPHKHSFLVPRTKSSSIHSIEHSGGTTLMITFMDRKTQLPGNTYSYNIGDSIFHVLQNADRPGEAFRGMLKSGAIPTHYAKKAYEPHKRD